MAGDQDRDIERRTTRRMWLLYEPVHALVYFSPEVTDAYKAIGLKGFWQGYFAGRVAPMGPVGAEVCEATFFGFAPEPVRRALPAAWTAASPAAVMAARNTALRPLLAQVLDPDGEAGGAIAEAADLAATAVEGCGLAGRALFAGHATLPAPDDPGIRLWWASTLLREHRGDGHVAALVAAGLDGLQANVLMVATGAMTGERIRGARSWSEETWNAAEAALVGRGLLDGGGTLTAAGRDLRGEVEDRTDDLAAEPWRHLGPEGTARLDDLLVPLRRRLLAAGRIPEGNPIGLPLDDVT